MTIEKILVVFPIALLCSSGCMITKVYSVAIGDLQRLWVEQPGVSAPRTIGLTVGIAAATVITIARQWRSGNTICTEWPEDR
jgi:hypothetical protein